MEEITEFPDDNMVEEGTGESPDVGLEDVYPRPDEDLLDFLYRCKNKGSQACLCPRCGALTDKIAAKNFQKLQLEKNRGKPYNQRFLTPRDPRRAMGNSHVKPQSYIPAAKAPNRT